MQLKLKLKFQTGNLFLETITFWCQLEDMFQLIVMPQGIEKVTIQLIGTHTKVYGIIGDRLFFYQRCP